MLPRLAHPRGPLLFQLSRCVGYSDGGRAGGLRGFAFGACAMAAGAPALWLVAGLLLGAAIPFTLIVTRQLLQRWAMLHAVRGCLSLASSLMFLVLAIWR